MKKAVLKLLSQAIVHSADKELRKWPPPCAIGIWYQPQRPLSISALPIEKIATPAEKKNKHR